MSRRRKSDDLKDMEQLVAAMLSPLRGQPLRLFVRSFTGYEMLPAPRKAAWLRRLGDALTEAGQKINQQGLYSRRANEVGNKIEPFVKEALNDFGFKADVPKTRDGRRQTAGYPDIEVQGLNSRRAPRFYLECKTYNPDNADSSLRSFYLSPPLAKVSMNAVHLLVAYRMEVGQESARQNGLNRYYARDWRLLDLYDLLVDVKHEIQTSNRALYANAPILRGTVE